MLVAVSIKKLAKKVVLFLALQKQRVIFPTTATLMYGKKSTLLNNGMKSGVYISEFRYRVWVLSTFLLLQKQVVAASIKKLVKKVVLFFSVVDIC